MLSRFWFSEFSVKCSEARLDPDLELDMNTSEAMPLERASFEVFGVVQGVFFRKFTQKEATRLGVCGWVRNTSSGSVEGEVEGPSEKLDAMLHWLGNVGSPRSKILKIEVRDRRPVEQTSFKEFDIRK